MLVSIGYKYLFPFAILSACSGQSNNELVCGEVFCLAADQDLVSVRSPVEDFKVYSVRWRGRDFTIYEGSNPPSLGSYVRDVGSKLGAGRGRLVRGSSGVSVYIELPSQEGPVSLDEESAPSRLVISTACSRVDECQIEEFVANLIAR
jgi:hypothetical protein